MQYKTLNCVLTLISMNYFLHAALIANQGFVLSHRHRNMASLLSSEFLTYRSSQGRGCVSRPPRCHSDPHTSTARCCCDTGETCSNLPHCRMADTDLHVQAKTHKTHTMNYGNTPFVCVCVCWLLCVCVCFKRVCLTKQFLPRLLSVDTGQLCFTRGIWKGETRDSGNKLQESAFLGMHLFVRPLLPLCAFVVMFVILLSLLLQV